MYVPGEDGPVNTVSKKEQNSSSSDNNRRMLTGEISACSALKLKLYERGENKTHELAMTADTRLTAVFVEKGVGGWSPEDSLHPEKMAPMTCPDARCDSIVFK